MSFRFCRLAQFDPYVVEFVYCKKDAMAERKIVNGHPFIAYQRETYSPEEMLSRGRSFFEWMNKRRSVRDFSDKPVAREVIENIIKVASTAPSGAHKQPWTFCVVSDPLLKRKIREAAEEEEYESYHEETGIRQHCFNGIGPNICGESK